MKPLRLTLPLLVVAALCAPAALAQPSRQDRREAQRLYRAARQLERAGDHRAAAEAYEQADELNSAPSYRLGYARMLLEQGQLVEAADALEACASMEPRQWAEKRVRKRCAALAEEVSERIPTLEVEIVSPGDEPVEVTVDGDEIDPGDGPLSLDPGSYEIEASAAGHDPWTEQVEIEEGEQVEIGIRMRAKPPPPPSEDEESGGLSPVPAYVLWAVGGVGVGVGVGFGIAAIDATHVVRTDYGCDGDACPPRAAEDINTAQTDGNLSTAGFALGGACLVGGTILYFLSDDDPGDEEEHDTAAIRVEPAVAVTFWGLRGSF
ncbi:MAG: hypothetical protein JRI23_11315 [Deltaproteobacteria bacterium]|jgi:tetratricopeptide (TPR) repeat protein|nr:hypothetical protein [Deltaproteobacteria bacterium]MBW2532283.1 hypothetical protein [Deltaproteobacteria bacterium]